MTISPPAVRLGGRAPRVRSVPDYVSSAGDEAADLAASTGLLLDPWQRDVLSAALGERRDGRWAAFEVGLICARQNGKGAVLEARELFGLFLAKEKLITHTAHMFSTSLEAFRRIKYLIESTPDLDRKVKRMWETTGREGIEILPHYGGGRLRFLARSKGSGRGFAGDVVIWDEAFALTEEHVDALMPTMSARFNPQIWYTTSPPLDAASGAPLFRLKDRGEKNDPALAWFDWSAERGTDLDDRDIWYATNPAMGIRITEEFVEAERRAMSDDGFARERLCVWPVSAAEQWQVVDESTWLASQDASSAALDPLCFAVDVTPDRSHAAIGAAGARADGDLHVEVVDHRPGTGWVVERCNELHERWKPSGWVVDPGGPAGSLIPELEAEGIEITTMKARDVAAAFGMVYDGLVRGTGTRRLWHRDDPRLSAAMAGAVKRRVGGDGSSWDRRTTSVDISPLVVVTNAVFGFVTRPETPVSEPWVLYA